MAHRVDHRRASVKGAARASLSPPVWKDQLKQRCMQRLKQDRGRLLAKLRSPDASTSIAAEMRRIVRKEGRRDASGSGGSDGERGSQRRHAVFNLLRSDDVEKEDEEEEKTSGHSPAWTEQEMLAADSSIDELLESGKLSQQEYLELVHSLEEALLEEMELEHAGPNDEELAESMMEFEEASLEAMLAGMDLDDAEPPAYEDDLFADADVGMPSETYMLCPICKANSLHERAGATPSISCACGFSFSVKHVLNGVIEDFREKLVSAFLTHRDFCSTDPSFEKAQAQDRFTNTIDAMRIRCDACGCDQLLL